MVLEYHIYSTKNQTCFKSVKSLTVDLLKSLTMEAQHWVCCHMYNMYKRYGNFCLEIPKKEYLYCYEQMQIQLMYNWLELSVRGIL